MNEFKIASFAMGLVKGSAPMAAVLEKYGPAIAAGLPLAQSLIQKGANAYGAFESAGQPFIEGLKAMAAQARFSDATRADEITTDEAVAFARPLIAKG